MQKINIHVKESIDKNKLKKNIKELIGKRGIYNPNTEITIFEGENGSSFFSNPNIEVFCELFAYENSDITEKKDFLKEAFSLINHSFNISLDSLAGVIHQLNKDHYISKTEDFVIENSLREDSFKTLGI